MTRSTGDLDLVVGGYVVVVPTPSPPTTSVLPATILTVSHCLMDAPSQEFSGWFMDPDEAHAASAGTPGARVVAVGIECRDAEQLMRRSAGAGVPEYFAVLHRMLPLPEDATLLGYEVVGVEAIFAVHSWHCYDYAARAAEALGATVDGAGLLADPADALRVRDWMLALPPSEQPAPVPWIVIALAA